MAIVVCVWEETKLNSQFLIGVPEEEDFMDMTRHKHDQIKKIADGKNVIRQLGNEITF